MVGVNKAKQKYSFNDHHIPFSFSFHQKFTMCGLGLPWFYSSFCFVFLFCFFFWFCFVLLVCCLFGGGGLDVVLLSSLPSIKTQQQNTTTIPSKQNNTTSNPNKPHYELISNHQPTTSSAVGWL
eukprot:m.59495 g.59495  ORF g.59495 m.59495 type:complete len:124 (+) comp22714_c2_seq1:150-521(+)